MGTVIDQRNQWQAGPEFSTVLPANPRAAVITRNRHERGYHTSPAPACFRCSADYVARRRAKVCASSRHIRSRAQVIPVATIIGPLLAGVLTGTFVVG